MGLSKKRKILLGLGLDHRDGHKRVTKGENFLLMGGSKQTHEEMQEKAIKLNEELKKKRKTLDQIERREFNEIANKIGLEPIPEAKSSRKNVR